MLKIRSMPALDFLAIRSKNVLRKHEKWHTILWVQKVTSKYVLKFENFVFGIIPKQFLL